VPVLVTCRGRAIGQEDRDGYRLKDKNGRPIICYNCDEAASAPKHRRIVSCDFCDQHWHLDCLDPPMLARPLHVSPTKESFSATGGNWGERVPRSTYVILDGPTTSRVTSGMVSCLT
jgi:hypothetical protein